MSFADSASLALELAHNLRYGRAFLKDVKGVDVLSDCVLVLVHPDGFELRLSAQVVMVSDAAAMCGVGLELRPFGPSVIAQIEAFGRGEREASPEGEASEGSAHAQAELPEPTETDRSASEAEGAEVEADEPSDDALDELETADSDQAELDADAELEGDLDEDAEEGAAGNDKQQQPARHERLRKLSQVEQQKMARSGELGDRVMLERLFGKAVWDALLHNPKVTPPEVARIARKGTVPRPLLDFIIDNSAWIQAGAVRRALLGNPRVTGEAVLKLLRLTPKHELKAMTKGTAYASHVRDAARKLLKI